MGSNLAQKICTNQNFVIGLDKEPNKNFTSDKFYICNILDINKLSISDLNLDTIVHLAAEHRDDVEPSNLYYETNYQGTKEVVKFAEKNNINKIIFTSSVAVYGINLNNSSEDDSPNPFNHYGKSKLMAEEVLNKWYIKNKKRTLVIIRPTVIFGPGNKGNVHNLINQIKNKKFLMIGKGQNMKSLAYIDNFTNFIVELLNISSGKFIYNYSDKPDLKINDLINQIYKSLNMKRTKFHLNQKIGLLGGFFIDLLSRLTNRQFSVRYT